MTARVSGTRSARATSTRVKVWLTLQAASLCLDIEPDDVCFVFFSSTLLSVLCFCFSRYFVLPGVKQATFSGAQLRAGAAAYGLMTAGLFGPANWTAVKARAKARIANKAAGHPDGDGSPYDWEPFFERFGDMLPEDAVTATMIAFGELMHYVHGYNEAGARSSRAERTAAVRQQTRNFVLGMLEPLFGRKSTPKLHEVLCHACDEVMLRDDLCMADTSFNEQKHKEEKAGYKLTNRQVQTAGRQQLKVTQARLILQAEKDELAANATGGHDRDGDDSETDESDDNDEPAALSDSRSVRLGATGGALIALRVITSRPGMSKAASVLGLPADGFITVLSSTRFTATYEWGALPSPELVRSAESYHNAAWHDDVMYRPADGGDVRYGRVRLVAARGSACHATGVVLVQRMKLAVPLTGSPFAAAGYKRLRWAFDDDAAEWPTLEAVPIDRLLRICQIVPDVELLDGSRRLSGQRAVATDGVRDRFFLLNKLFKSTTPAQQRAIRLLNSAS